VTITTQELTHVCHSVEVRVEGTRPDKMQAEALAAAANFFRVTPDKLRVGLWTAEPFGYTVSGGISGWKAYITITLERQ
jgi:hypothetical protein